jgi:HAMP domain-containing protein
VIVARPEQRALQVLAELINTAVALAQSPAQLSRLFMLITVLAASLVLVGSVLISGQITVPLVELSKMAQQVQAGDLSANVNVRSKDEVGVLGNAFNLMTYGLRQRERERDIFGRVVSPPVREKLLSGELQLGGETRWVAVLFSDIRNFTATSETMTPQEVVAFLNEYLTEMSQAITPWGGYINNFIGDAIVAIFGAPLDQPDKEWRAVAAYIHARALTNAQPTPPTAR